MLKKLINLNTTNRNNYLFIALSCCLLFLLIANISYGTITIPFKEIIKSLTGSRACKETWEYIIFNYRLPKAITAVLVGMGLSISGLLMQTLFRNPLAGPYVLGLSSGSSLMVALVIMGSSVLPPFIAQIFFSPYGIIFASCIGSLLVLFAVVLQAVNRLANTRTFM